MNRYFDQNEIINSNKRIIEAYFSESVKPVSAWKKTWDSLLGMVLALLGALSCTTVRRVAKAGAVAVTLLCFVGLIGAMEKGAIGLGTGVLLSLPLLGIEYLCLRPRTKAHED